MADAPVAVVRVPAPPLATLLLSLTATLLGFVLLQQATDFVAHQEQGYVFVWCAVIAIVAGVLAPARTADATLPVRTFLRGAAIFMVIYLALDPLAVPYTGLGEDSPAALLHRYGHWVALVLAVAGWWRVSAVFAAAALLWMLRELQTALTGFYFSTLDIRTAYEGVMLVALGTALILTAARRRRLAERLALDADAVEHASMLVLAAAIGQHLANYFYSALAKLALDGGPLSWVLDNQLYAGIPGALEKGTLLFAGSPAAITAVYNLMVTLALPMNIAAFALQLAAPFAVKKRRWLIWTTVGYDLFHLAVYIALGLFFWKWIAINTIIVATLVRMDDDQWERLTRRTALVFLFGAPILFKTATLAWYDTPGFASPHFEAVLADGRRMTVPNSWFLTSSYQVSQGRMFWPAGEATGHFNPSIWGSVLTHADLMAGRTCTLPAKTRAADVSYGTLAKLARYVRFQHLRMEHWPVSYRLLPHHHMPSPFVTDPFASVPPGAVARYDLVLESVCLSLDHGRLRRHVLKRDDWPLYAPGPDKLLQ